MPIEIYCFTNDTAWASYERIQGDIFDHLIAILPEFGLQPFQEPAGSDLSNLGAGLVAAASREASTSAPTSSEARLEGPL